MILEAYFIMNAFYLTICERTLKFDSVITYPNVTLTLPTPTYQQNRDLSKPFFNYKIPHPMIILSILILLLVLFRYKIIEAA